MRGGGLPLRAEVPQESKIAETGVVSDVNGQTTINITLLQDAANLDKVVVGGYGKAKKSDLAGSYVPNRNYKFKLY